MMKLFGNKKGPPSSSSDQEQGSWIFRLKAGLKRSSDKLTTGLTNLFTQKKIDENTLEELEELLITSDLGPSMSSHLVSIVQKMRFDKDVTYEQIQNALAKEIMTILTPVAQPLVVDTQNHPHVIVIAGVNGSGKTTTIGKLAYTFRADGRSVVLAAGDMFRSGAVEQLKIWGQRADCPVITQESSTDAAGLAYDALNKCRLEGHDVLLIDTAGRLHNKSHLMAELQKIKRVLQKIDPTAPHSCLLILDATTGQNAHSQVDIFHSMIDVTGLIITKLDGSARGGIIVALAEKFGLPIHAIGVGEKIDDLLPFSADIFAYSLVGASK